MNIIDPLNVSPESGLSKPSSDSCLITKWLAIIIMKIIKADTNKIQLNMWTSLLHVSPKSYLLSFKIAEQKLIQLVIKDKTKNECQVEPKKS